MTPSGIKSATFRHRVPLYQQWFPLRTKFHALRITTYSLVWLVIQDEESKHGRAVGHRNKFCVLAGTSYSSCHVTTNAIQQATKNTHTPDSTLNIPTERTYVVLRNHWHVTVSACFVTNETRSVNTIRHSVDGQRVTFKTYLMQDRNWGTSRAGDVYLDSELVLETYLQSTASGADNRSGLLQIHDWGPPQH
jgi:hypothetical protein